MQMADLGEVRLHYEDLGDKDAPAIVFANSLGTDYRMWNKIMPSLPAGLRTIRYDKRGHGLSTCPEGPWGMGDLVADVAGLLDHLGVKDCLFVGLSIGGMTAQGLAAERPDLVRAMVISNTGAKIGTQSVWDERIAAARAGGIEALADAVMGRWFSKKFRAEKPGELEAWRNMLTRTPLDGYIGCSHAIAGTDLWDSTARLRLPTLGIAGSEDGSTPPDLMRETTGLIPGSKFHLVRGAGHLPCIEKPEEYAEVLNGFIKAVGHI